MDKKWLHMIAFILVIIGGINWGLYALILVPEGAEGFDLVQVLFGFSATLQEIVYILIGVSAVYLAVTHTKDCKICSAK